MVKVFLAVITAIGLSGNSFAGFIITIGSNVPLLAGTPNQAVDVFLTSDSIFDPAIKGMNLSVYIGNDASHVIAGDQGVFSGVPGSLDGVQLLGAGYFWNQGNGSSPGGAGPVVNAPAVIQAGVNFNLGIPQSITANTSVLIATLRIDTTGINSGTYAITLDGSFDFIGLGAPSNIPTTELLDSLDAVIPGVSFTNGSYKITAVPEPSTLIFFAIGVGTVAFCRRGTEISQQPIR